MSVSIYLYLGLAISFIGVFWATRDSTLSLGHRILLTFIVPLFFLPLVNGAVILVVLSVKMSVDDYSQFVGENPLFRHLLGCVLLGVTIIAIILFRRVMGPERKSRTSR